MEPRKVADTWAAMWALCGLAEETLPKSATLG